jgi:DNA polymerase III delta prime subunit
VHNITQITFLKPSTGTSHFVPNACDHLDPYLTSRIVGQDLALRQISDAICDHLAQATPRKPLVLSIHGPPGVGKSLFHQEAARALYNTNPNPDLRCPGPDCGGYKVLFGLDFTADDREAQHAALRAALDDHMRYSPESFLVLEEYDKLDCTMRGFFRHILEGGTVGNYSLAKSIIILESNTGYTSLHSMLQHAGSREKISPEKAQKELKDLVFERWRKQGCEERTDTMKMVGLVDFFLPFFPLERKHIKELFELRLQEKAAAVQKQLKLSASSSSSSTPLIKWDAAVVDFLTGKVDFEGPYPIEGGKEVGTLMSRYVSRPVREWTAAQEIANLEEKKNKKQKKKDKENAAMVKQRPAVGRLKLSSSRDRLEIVADVA